MASREKMRQIDAQWQALQPGLGKKNHNGERKILYDTMDDDEHIEVLVGCVWGPEKAFRPGASRWDKMTQYDGIAVVTESRVALLKKRGLNKLTTDMPLLTIESVDVDGEGAVTLTGQSSSNWFGDGNAGAFKLRDVQNGYARNFADRIRERMASDAASVEALLSRILEDGEHVEQWAAALRAQKRFLNIIRRARRAAAIIFKRGHLNGRPWPWRPAGAYSSITFTIMVLTMDRW